MQNFNNRDELLESLKNEFKANFAEYAVVYFDEENYEVFGFIDETLSPLELHKFSLKEISKRLYLDIKQTFKKLKNDGCDIKKDNVYQIVAKNKEVSATKILSIKWLDKKQTFEQLINDNKVKDSVFKVKFIGDKYVGNEELDDFLFRALNGENGYGLATAADIYGRISDFTVYFRAIGKNLKRKAENGLGNLDDFPLTYTDECVELLSWALDDTTTIVRPDGSLKTITYKEAAESCESYCVHNDRIYELDGWFDTALPLEIEDLRIISEKECLNWMIANSSPMN